MPTFEKEFEELARFFNKELPEEVGSMGLEFIEQNFQKEAFQEGGKSKKWAPRKNDPDSKLPRDQRRALLVQSGAMKNGFDYDAMPGRVVFYNDLERTKWHNEGTEKLPQRQMMGPSKKLDMDIHKLVEKKLKKIFKTWKPYM